MRGNISSKSLAEARRIFHERQRANYVAPVFKGTKVLAEPLRIHGKPVDFQMKFLGFPHWYV